ncbi:hypothetical protein P8452_08719 [Trifolium repens]|nr:hypothetical protein P8452_08719 [Trifolium repens]
MTTFNIPWKCLDLSTEPKITNIDPPKPSKPKTFAQALNNLCDIPLSQFPQPVVKGDRLAIEIPESIYEAGLEACKHNLHGRILWPKGSTPLSAVALKTKLSQVWKDLSKWGLISLGKGFFEFTFSSLEDVKRVRSVPSWNLNPGLLKLFAWTKDFNPKLQQNTSAQVWVKIFGLSQEYWHKTILFTIAGSLGTPICIDSVTAKPMHERTFGQFARVLVDIDLLQPLRYKVLVERKGFAFFVELEYEYIPEFCHGCKMIGHNFDQCRKWNKDENLLHDKEIPHKRKAPIAPKQIFAPVNGSKSQQNNMTDVIHNTAENENHNREIAVINVEESGSKSPQINMVDQGNNATSVNNDTPQIDAVQFEPVLTPLSPRTIQLQQDALLEKELNENMDSESVSSSQDSIVKDTQNVEDKNKAIVVSSMPLQGTTTHDVASASRTTQPPDRVLKDMALSWANMVEAEETIHEALQDKDQMEDTTDEFQVKLTKNQKRAQKKLNQSSKDSYATRSKVVPKPFR